VSAPRWPDVVAGLLALPASLPAFSGVPVYDGQPITQDTPTAWLTVGYVSADGAGQFAQSNDPGGFATIEVGDVLCHLAAVDGGTDLPATRTVAFALLAALQTGIENDQTLAGHIPDGSVVSMSTQVLDLENQQGSATSLLVTVHYQTLTYFNP
jgi:hypothetical protein